jgi:hypothetical protein
VDRFESSAGNQQPPTVEVPHLIFPCLSKFPSTDPIQPCSLAPLTACTSQLDLHTLGWPWGAGWTSMSNSTDCQSASHGRVLQHPARHFEVPAVPMNNRRLLVHCCLLIVDPTSILTAGAVTLSSSEIPTYDKRAWISALSGPEKLGCRRYGVAWFQPACLDSSGLCVLIAHRDP